MNYCTIYKGDLINGRGVRVTLFVSGCSHHCPGCFNQRAWNEDYGKPYTQDTEDTIITYMKAPYIAGLTLLGGEPMDPGHQEMVWNLVHRVRSELPDKNIWLYSGYTLDELRSMDTPFVKNILANVDVLVDGRFVQALKDPDLAFKGSSNQRIIDMRKTGDGEPVLLSL
jgi:anaerobic ribonucleoside-triphosphate reductase activating protein